MKKTQSLKLLASAVTVTVSMMGFATAAHAQYRVGADGHANDANNRIGSGGYNGGRTNYPNQYGTASNIINNEVNGQIITGNVNGLNYFHGASNEFDPNVVQTRVGTASSDRFLAISESSNNEQRNTGAPRATAYYSSDRLTVQPENFVTTPNGLGVVPSTAIKNTPNDTRLGDINVGSSNVYLPTPGELDLPGPLDSSGNASSLVASPLYGMRQFNTGDAGDAYFLSRYSNVAPNGPVQAARANNAQLQQMRNELNSTMVPNSTDAKAGNSPSGITPANANLNQSQALNNSTPLSANASLSGQALSSNLNNQPLNGNPNPALGTRQEFTALIPADQQSTQLKELVQRLAKTKQQTPEQSAESYNELRRLNAIDQQKAQDAKTATASPGGTTPTPGGGATPTAAAPDAIIAAPGNPGGALKPEEPAPAPMNPMLSGPITSTSDKPYVITSLATGIKAAGLANLLTTAELQMRQGKFSSALDTYDTARQVAPNNPFAVLGRAFANLGAAAYGRAESDLRRSFAEESGAVLLGQYDLRGFLGEDRLKFVVKDLREINNKEKNERAAFLLGYIAHNVGDDNSASRLLDDAKQRAGGNDPVIQLMRQNWQLKSDIGR